MRWPRRGCQAEKQNLLCDSRRLVFWFPWLCGIQVAACFDGVPFCGWKWQVRGVIPTQFASGICSDEFASRHLGTRRLLNCGLAIGNLRLKFSWREKCRRRHRPGESLGDCTGIVWETTMSNMLKLVFNNLDRKPVCSQAKHSPAKPFKQRTDFDQGMGQGALPNTRLMLGTATF